MCIAFKYGAVSIRSSSNTELNMDQIILDSFVCALAIFLTVFGLENQPAVSGNTDNSGNANVI